MCWTERPQPWTVCLCGSTKFREAYEEARRNETLSGRIVLDTGGVYGHQEGMEMDGPIKRMLDALHLKKIEMADEILVLNVGGYVGESTRHEIAHAESLGKRIRFLERTK